MHSWLASFLTKRKMRVVLEGEQSSEVTVDSGVLQSTVLGPILFLCHKMTYRMLSNHKAVCLHMTACLYHPINSQKDHDILQQDLGRKLGNEI